MATEPTLQLAVERPQPVVWISRLLILDSTDPWKVVRDVPLHRGLNIVWSVDVDRNDETAPVMTGHGVGKTTFCRLLRYCLGEASFGRKPLVQLIRAAMPDAVVGAEVFVEGERWAVLRPLGRSYLSYAKRDISLEELIADRPPSRTFHEFTERLAKVALGGFAPDVTLTGNRPLLWDHILAWCARDQEARYQNFWDWRSTRSDSETPSFARHREDPMYLVRASLGLVATTEILLQRRLTEIEGRLKKLEELIAERLREPEFQVRRLRRSLVEEFDIAEAQDAPIETAELFSLPALVTQRTNSLNADGATLDAQIVDFNRKLLALQTSIQDTEQMAGEWSAASATTEAGSAGVAASTPKYQEERNQLADIAGLTCRYGGVTFGDCEYVQDRARRLDELINSGATTTVQIAGRDQDSAEMRERAEQLEKRRQSLVAEREALLKSKGDLEGERSSLRQKANALPLVMQTLAGWNAIVLGASADESLVALRTEQNSLTAEHEVKNSELAKALAAQGQRLENLKRVFGGLVTGVLNSEFRGAVQIRGGEIACSITHGSVLAGEAVETLGVLLTDLMCLLLAAEKHCLHPGFHVHDSPREADLGARIYRRFLGCIGLLHSSYGGKQAAPFQYIVTTTTAPPADLQSDEHVCLRLSNEREEDLMLGRSLGAPVDLDSPSLFAPD